MLPKSTNADSAIPTNNALLHQLTTNVRNVNCLIILRIQMGEQWVLGEQVVAEVQEATEALYVDALQNCAHSSYDELD